jgi:hypothetical protein
MFIQPTKGNTVDTSTPTKNHDLDQCDVDVEHSPLLDPFNLLFLQNQDQD